MSTSLWPLRLVLRACLGTSETLSTIQRRLPLRHWFEWLACMWMIGLSPYARCFSPATSPSRTRQEKTTRLSIITTLVPLTLSRPQLAIQRCLLDHVLFVGPTQIPNVAQGVKLSGIVQRNTRSRYVHVRTPLRAMDIADQKCRTGPPTNAHATKHRGLL
jgi:hypothetical protein